MRRARPWLISLVVLVALLIGADRIAAVVAENRAADKIRTAQDLSSTPNVHIDGFPFLTQVADHRLDKVEVTAKNVTVGQGGRTVHLQQFKAVLQHVTLHGLSSATANTATATVVIGYRELTGVLGVPISYGGTTPDGHGRIAAKATVTVLGQQVSGTATAEVAVSGDTLSFEHVSATADGAQVPEQVTSVLSNVFAAPLSLARFPFHLSLQSVSAGPNGVTVVLVAHDVTYG